MAKIKSDATKGIDRVEEIREETKMVDDQGNPNTAWMKRLDDLEQANEDLRKQLKSQGVSKGEQSSTIADLVRELKAAVDPKAAVVNCNSGQAIVVERGEFMGYWPTKGGRGRSRGGWFKCHRDDELKYDGPNQIAVANERHVYDSGEGILQHQFKHTPYKMFKQGGVDVQGDGQPRSKIVTPRRELVGV